MKSAGYFVLSNLFAAALAFIGGGAAATRERNNAVPAEKPAAASLSHWTRLEPPVPGSSRLSWAESELQPEFNAVPALPAHPVATLIEQVVAKPDHAPDFTAAWTVDCFGDSCSAERAADGLRILLPENVLVSDQASPIENPQPWAVEFSETNPGTSLRSFPSLMQAPLAAPMASSAPRAPAPAVQPVAGSAPVQNTSKYTGEPISVNLKDVDLKDFFRLIHEISGLNVVLDPNVKGNLTLVLSDVPWDQALEIVLRNNSLDRQLEGDVLRIATKETLKKEAEESRDLAKAQIEAADVVTTTRTLSYAKVVDVRETLKQFLSPRGQILADSRSNSLVIRDIPTVLPVLDKLIEQLDRRSQQVEIEARVVLATRQFAREIGTQFGVLGSGGSDHNVVGGVPAVGTSPVTRTTPQPSPATSTGQIPLNSNLPPTAPTSGILFAHTEGNLALDIALSAAESKGLGKLLSRPKVITQNNETATVKQGTKIPVQTIINNTISVQFIDAVLKLQVTPQITPDGNVFLDVLVENTQIDPAIERIDNIPALDTQATETKVLIRDGGTVVIGGIIISSQRTAISQVPLFGNIPVLGNLFKHTQVNNQSQELLFFLTPRVIPAT